MSLISTGSQPKAPAQANSAKPGPDTTPNPLTALVAGEGAVGHDIVGDYGVGHLLSDDFVISGQAIHEFWNHGHAYERYIFSCLTDGTTTMPQLDGAMAKCVTETVLDPGTKLPVKEREAVLNRVLSLLRRRYDYQLPKTRAALASRFLVALDLCKPAHMAFDGATVVGVAVQHFEENMQPWQKLIKKELENPADALVNYRPQSVMPPLLIAILGLSVAYSDSQDPNDGARLNNFLKLICSAVGQSAAEEGVLAKFVIKAADHCLCYLEGMNISCGVEENVPGADLLRRILERHENNKTQSTTS